MAATVLELFEGSTSLIHHADGAIAATVLAGEGRRLAASWRSDGLEPGDRVAVYADNGLAYLRSIAAAAAGRFVLVSVNRRYAPEEAQSLVARSGAHLVVTDANPSIFQAGSAPLSVIEAAALAVPSVALADEPAPLDELVTEVVAADDPFVVFTTSGTTSRPKMVLHHQRSIAVHAFDAAARFELTAADRVLVALPLCGVFGFDSLTAAVAADSDVWLPNRFDALAVADLVASEAITTMNGSDDMFHRMLGSGADLSTVRVGGYGRFNTSLDGIVGRAAERGLTLTGLYGMSEVQALFALRDPSEAVLGRERAGGTTASPSAHFRIVDPESGDDLDVGLVGELQLIGPSLFAGYLDEGGARVDRALTDAAHVEADGMRWFRTGDLAQREADGTFTYLTRMGDVLRLGGFLVSPAEIEAVVLQSPGIEAAAAVAIARPGGVRAAVIVVADHEPDSQAIIAHCNDHLARYKVPIAVIRVDEFPTTPSANGTKIRVGELRALAEAALS